MLVMTLFMICSSRILWFVPVGRSLSFFSGMSEQASVGRSLSLARGALEQVMQASQEYSQSEQESVDGQDSAAQTEHESEPFVSAQINHCHIGVVAVKKLFSPLFHPSNDVQVHQSKRSRGASGANAESAAKRHCQCRRPQSQEREIIPPHHTRSAIPPHRLINADAMRTCPPSLAAAQSGV